MSQSILAICKCFETLNAEGICVSINNDRLIASFPLIDEHELELELNDYRRDILSVIEDRTSRLSSEQYIELSERLADEYAEYGSLLLDDLLASYELKIFPQLEEQQSMIAEAVSRTGANVSEKFFAELLGYLMKWRKLADPLLTAAKFTGMEDNNVHRQGREIFETVQKLALTLNNEHGRPEDALRLMLIMQEYLGSVCESLSEKIDRDVTELRMIKDQKAQAEKQAKREREAWERSIYYETEFGLIFRDKLIISAKGISWKGVLTPLEEVSGMCWGGTNRYVNGVYMGTDYKIEISAYRRISLNPNEQKYTAITSHLWRALAGLISDKILQQLKNGEMLYFGSIKLRNDGVYLRKSGWFSSDTRFFTWSDRLRISSYNGSLVIAKDNYSAQSSYMDDMNTHILEAMLRHFLSTPNHGALLSSLLE